MLGLGSLMWNSPIMTLHPVEAWVSRGVINDWITNVSPVQKWSILCPMGNQPLLCSTDPRYDTTRHHAPCTVQTFISQYICSGRMYLLCSMPEGQWCHSESGEWDGNIILFAWQEWQLHLAIDSRLSKQVETSWCYCQPVAVVWTNGHRPVVCKNVQDDLGGWRWHVLQLHKVLESHIC